MSEKESSSEAVEVIEAAPSMDEGIACMSPLRNNDEYCKKQEQHLLVD